MKRALLVLAGVAMAASLATADVVSKNVVGYYTVKLNYQGYSMIGINWNSIDGTGICHDGAESCIERNLFDFNRHSIAGTGCPGTGYEAAHNVELGDSLSHCFDMHGGRDRRDGTDIAGTWFRIHHNTFRAVQTPIVIRGTPEREGVVEYNWFPNHEQEGKGTNGPAVIGGDRLVVRNNLFLFPPKTTG